MRDRRETNLMNRILKPPTGKVDNIVLLIEKWDEMVRRQDQSTGRQAQTDDTKRVIMMDMCLAEVERHLILNSDRFGTYPELKAATRDYVEQISHNSGPVELGEMAPLADKDGEGEWEDVRAVGRAKGKGKSKGNIWQIHETAWRQGVAEGSAGVAVPKFTRLLVEKQKQRARLVK